MVAERWIVVTCTIVTGRNTAAAGGGGGGGGGKAMNIYNDMGVAQIGFIIADWYRNSIAISRVPRLGNFRVLGILSLKNTFLRYQRTTK